MKKEIYKAAATGDIEFLKEAQVKDMEAAVAIYSDDDLLGLTSHGNNIIHVATKHGQLEFIKNALESIQALLESDLICGKNNDGDTPLHLAAKQETATIAEHLITFYRNSEWRIQNNEGNTPLHVALMRGGKCIQVAAYLLKIGPEVASYANHHKETPLHLAVDYDNKGAKISMTRMMNKLNGLGASLDYMKSLFEEDSLSVIKKLLETTTTVCCLRDEDGMTPLLRATLVSYTQAVEAIINYCPESLEISDTKGRSVLHHIKFPTFLEARNFLRTPGVFDLMDEQDNKGNTPLHTAIMKCEYNMVKAMIECNANFAIKNKEGTSAATLIESNSDSFLDKTKDDIRQSKNIKDEVMPKELFEAAYDGKWQWLLERLKEPAYKKQFLSLLPDGTNILHVAVQYCSLDCDDDFMDYSNDENNYSSKQEEFIVEAPKKYPILICQTDYKGCTPLHFAMSRNTLKPGGRAFETMLDNLRHIKDQSIRLPLPPWEAKDLNGDTLLHLAVMYRRFEMAKFVIDITDAKLVGETNNSNETPLHCLCRYTWAWFTDCLEIVDVLIEKDATVVYSYDADGFTPLLRAVQNEESIKIAERIIDRYPESIKQVDSHFGRNVFHLMDLKPYHLEFMKLPQMKNLLTQVDSQGNLPLHVALQDRRFGSAKLLILQHKELKELLSVWLLMVNNDGKTCNEVFSTIEDAPNWFKEFLSSEKVSVREVEEVEKSLYDVPYSKMKDFMGTIGVVAALLATITFTAAFTVPGGYEQNNDRINGTPTFAKQVAFQVFMFTDVVGMCSSIMSLICLIWFFTSEGKKIGFLDEGPALGDLSMGFLQLSFYATLVAFMTGVYVTTLPEVRWLAISTCVICCLVLLLMRKRFILQFLIYLFGTIFTLDYLLSHIIKVASRRCFKWIGRRCFKSRNREDSL